VSKNIATLDHVSLGRAGWKVTVSTTDADAALFGRKPAAPLDELYAEASDAIEVVARLWDSWEDDAVIRDQPTGRYIDRDKVHYVDFEGRFFNVRGPSITPRSPQGQPLVAIDATSAPAVHVAGEQADLAFVEHPDVASTVAARDEIRALGEAAGRDPDAVAVLATVDVLLAPDTGRARDERARLDELAGDGPPPSNALDFVGTPLALADVMEEWYRAGAVDGFVLRPALLPRGLTQLVDEVVPILQARGVFHPGYEGRTLRDHFGWSRPANRYAVRSATS
jgi:alkanesulfonate monooxygenase SsuD/methylene tetrahydromethanopterin reductase-like flavin-dependent oxidoreductase (luciferase family)